MCFRHHFRHLYDICNGEAIIEWNRDSRSILVAVVLTILTGPLLPLGWWMQHWCAASSWDNEDRWAGTRQFAITLLLLIYVPLILNLVFFHTPVVHWPHFSLVLVWSDLLVCAWYVVFWWIILLPLVPTFALISEHIDPRTRGLERILLPEEKPSSSQSHGNAQEAKPARKKATSKKRKKGQARPLGELLLEEKASREQQTHAIQQLALPASSGQASPTEDPVLPSTPSSEPLPTTKPDRDNRESLKDLF